MPRSLFVAGTDYSHQSFTDMISDLNNWLDSIREVNAIINKDIEGLTQNGYWDKVQIDFKNLIGYAVHFHETSIDEIFEILAEMQMEVRPDHVKRIDRLGKTAIELEKRYSRVWYKNDLWALEEDNNLVCDLYRQGRSMAADMIDLETLASRLEDFIGKKGKVKKKLKSTLFNSMELRPNFYGIGIDLKKLIMTLFNKR